ncbi:MAG: nucleotide exchange factor GrpE [Chloroflexi bacterium]|nr:nucleotide exchange factor GrpE [Chloroflexota bacterium]
MSENDGTVNMPANAENETQKTEEKPALPGDAPAESKQETEPQQGEQLTEEDRLKIEAEELADIIKDVESLEFLKLRLAGRLQKGIDTQALLGFYRIVSRSLKEELIKKQNHVNYVEMLNEKNQQKIKKLEEDFLRPDTDELNKLKTQLSEKEKMATDYALMVEKIQLDFDNFRNRTRRDQDITCEKAVTDLLLKILPSLDNFHRAIETDSGPEGHETYKKGIEMIRNQLDDTLKKIGLEEIPAAGNKFDPALHDILAEIPDAEHEEGTITEEILKGYKYKDRVIRAAKVNIAKKVT